MSRAPLEVLALAPYPEEAPSTRVRVSQYREALAGRGIRLHVKPFFTTEGYRRLKSSPHWVERGGQVMSALVDALSTLKSVGRYDVVLVQRGIAPLVESWALDALRASGVPLVYDFDDAVFLPQEGGRAVERLRNPAGVTTAFCRAATVVLAGNAYLADFARGAVGPGDAHRVHVVPSVVDTERLRPRPAGASRKTPAGAPVVVGWMGSDSSISYLETLRVPLAELSAEGTCRVVVIAGRRRPDLPGVDHSFVPWTEAGEADLVRGLDIGLYPLEDTPWARGKCGYKAVQYLAAGVPCVASPVGVLRELVRPDETGAWAETPEAWVRAIRALARDPAGRGRMAAAGRALVEEEYSLKSYAPVVADLLVAAAEGGT